MKLLLRLLLAGLILFAALQLIRPSIPAKPATAEVQAPPEVRHVLQKDCYSCHSDERRLSWFDEIVPGYWLVRHDVLTAREHLNFSTLGAKPAAAQRATLFEAVNMIQLGAMPLPQFTRLHPEARVNPDELATLKAYLSPWKTPPAPAAPDAATAPVSLTSIKPEFNGLPFDPTFESWTPISTTDRGDNNTFRFILGNDIAVKAAQSGNISPWPDGSRFAKIAWQQQSSVNGLIQPGKFIQVEFMYKDARLYKNTDGWGWGRWRGLDLQPYGTDAKFVGECTGCHEPVKGDDYVYTLPISAAKTLKAEVVNSHAAALPASLPWQPLGWHAITMYVDPKTHTTATLYGNVAAELSVRHDGTATLASEYRTGSVLALVTWVQREDPHWFGGRIPDTPQSVEFVQMALVVAYRHFGGATLTEQILPAAAAGQRTQFILGLNPARLP